MRIAEISLADLNELLEAAPDLEPVEPHPELVANIRPSAADVFLAAAEHCGWLPRKPYLHPAVPAFREE